MLNISSDSLKSGNVLLTMDYNNPEKRVLLSYSGDEYEVYKNKGNSEESSINTFRNSLVAKKFWSKSVKEIFWEELAYFEVQTKAEVVECDGKVSLCWRGWFLREFENELQAKVVGGFIALVSERNFEELSETIKRVELKVTGNNTED